MSGQVHFPRPRADLSAIVMDLNDSEHLSSLVPYFLVAAVLIGILDAYPLPSNSIYNGQQYYTRASDVDNQVYRRLRFAWTLINVEMTQAHSSVWLFSWMCAWTRFPYAAILFEFCFIGKNRTKKKPISLIVGVGVSRNDMSLFRTPYYLLYI